ncbi:MAG TPA: terminase gpA endonuclease subunit [Longimicrobiaceae bacterium]
MSGLARVAADVLRRAGRPRTRLTGSQWMNRYGWIARSSGAAEHGQYSTDRAPFLAEMADVFCDEIHQDVVVNKAAQVGYTELLLQYCAYVMREDPSGHLLVQPSIEAAKSWVKERMDPMLEESPHLRGLIRSEQGRRTSDDTLQRKVYRGGWTVVVGANSPTGLRSRPARRLTGDERSGWTLDARQEGDPWDLATERTNSFWNAKRIQGSTPGEEETCPITAALRQSDWREYHVPCPNCKRREPFQWKAPDGTYRLVCDRDPADQLIPQTARYLCTSCGTLIPETEKAWMLRPANGARWVPRFPGREVVGFDLTGLLSPWQSWATIMRKWVEAQRNHEKLKVFVTHVLAQPWRPESQRIEVHTLRQRAEPMPELPAPIGACFGAVDIQQDRIETLVIGVGAGEEVWCLEWESHEGAPEKDEPWVSAWAALTAPRGVPLYGIAIDTGYLGPTAWKWVDEWTARRVVKRVIGVKGEDGRHRPWIRKPARARTRRVRNPWIVGSDTAKDILALRLLNPVPPGGPGAFHFADSLDEAFYDQLTAEEQRLVTVRGRRVRAWRPVSKDRANEALDLTIYALAAMYAFGREFVDRIGDLAEQRRHRATSNASEPDPGELAPIVTDPDRSEPSKRPRRGRRGWAFRT